MIEKKLCDLAPSWHKKSKYDKNAANHEMVRSKRQGQAD